MAAGDVAAAGPLPVPGALPASGELPASGGLPELANVSWRKCADEASLRRADRTWTLSIVAHEVQVLTRTPERRVAHGVLLGCGVWVVNLHATAHDEAAAQRDGSAAGSAALRWARDDPVVLAGDFNLRAPGWPGFAAAGGHDVDHVFVAGAVEAARSAEVLERGTLSDHAPVAVDLRLTISEAGDGPDV